MNRQKRPNEESLSQDEEEEYKVSDSMNDSKKEDKDKKFLCICGKGYELQSSLFNHIRIKHGDDKEGFQVKRYTKPGRPKNVDGKDKAQQKTKKKEKKPEGLDESTWGLLQLYQNPLYQNLIIKFKDCMKSSPILNPNEEDQYWKQYEEQREQLFKKIKFPQVDCNNLKEKTDFLLQKWGIILEPTKRVNLYLSFIRAFIKSFYQLSDEKNHQLIQGWEGEYFKQYEDCITIMNLNQNYPNLDNNADSNSKDVKSQENLEHLEQNNFENNEATYNGNQFSDIVNDQNNIDEVQNQEQEDDDENFDPQLLNIQVYQQLANEQNNNQFNQNINGQQSIMNPASFNQPSFINIQFISRLQQSFQYSYPCGGGDINYTSLIQNLEKPLEQEFYDEDDQEINENEFQNSQQNENDAYFQYQKQNFN